MQKTLKTIIFDFDGVILDSADLKLEAFVEVYMDEAEDKRLAVREYARLNGGISRRTKFEYFERSLFKRPINIDSVENLCRRYGQLVDAQIKNAKFIEGALDALHLLRGHFSLHVVSGAPESDLQTVIADRNITSYFSSISGAPKNKVDVFENILLHEGVLPTEALAIGDSLTEYEAAEALGIPFLAVVANISEDPFPSNLQRITDLKNLPNIVFGRG